MDQPANLSKAYFLILIRLLIIVLCIFAIFLQSSQNLPAFFALNEAKLLVAMIILNVIYILFARFFAQQVQIFLTIQISIDLLAVSFLIYFSGGILSMFISLYFGVILAAGICLNPNLSILYASLSTISIAGIAVIYFIAAVARVDLPLITGQEIYPFVEHDFSFLRAYLFAQAVSFHLVAIFIRWLSVALSRQYILHAEILENLRDGVIVMDEKLVLSFVNVCAKKMLGKDIHETWNGRLATEFLNHPKHTSILKTVLLQKLCSFQIELETNDVQIPINVTLTSFATKKEVRAYILILRDMSEQKHIEEALKRIHRLETISEVAYTIAHEIRNPLASIRGAVQELRKSDSPQDAKNLLMDIVIRESDRLNRVITDFLQLSKLRPPSLQKINLHHLLQEFIYFLQKRPDMANAQIDLDIEPNITLYCDAEQIKQVFYNLAINALEATTTHLVLKIQARNCVLKDFIHKSHYPFYGLQEIGVMISFCDQGRGIPEQYINKIFTPFFTTKEQGTGMGLAMVKKIIDSHQGLCNVQSTNGQGAVFSLWLPDQDRAN